MTDKGAIVSNGGCTLSLIMFITFVVKLFVKTPEDCIADTCLGKEHAFASAAPSRMIRASISSVGTLPELNRYEFISASNIFDRD